MKHPEPSRERAMAHLNRGAVLALLICLSLLTWLALLPIPSYAHGVNVGELELDHPYAVPSVPGESHGKAYLRGITNAGTKPERLLGASTPMAAKVALHSLKPDAHGLVSQQLDAIDLPAKTVTRLRHTGDYQITLIDLKKPLKDGDRFELTLNFERAGSQTIKVWVQTPHEAATAHSH
ncbi:MAG: copper chaperone PCu(A)C [Rhodoferax sp.]|nr:copper chaperone PCu(A)C [Betaproteobacteria bacterium]NCN96882.1 copper chaperone PCu(A)C [Rhodoferax sp.]NCP81517.1 copper chaperone PCu(A)C [Rhodoferax sp.]PJC20910.1 MAG: copper-binding protein [Comamonadaceae bacterium CG_4_9_14_0_8_um_filter_57_21]